MPARAKSSRKASSGGPRGSARRRDPTIFDVAALAGVSKSTVSNVIRGSDDVAEATRERVKAAIETLGYRPNALARQFVRQRTTIIAVLIGDFDNPFYAELAKSVERYAFDAGYTAMFCNIERDPDLAVYRVEALLEQRVAGVAFLAFFGRSLEIESALQGRVPVVFMGLREDWGDSVSVSESAGARLATRHLLEAGHGRIAYLTTPFVESRASHGLAAGYRAAMRAANAKPSAPIHWEPGAEQATMLGEVIPLREALTGPDGATGAVCSNDLGAIALLEFADRHGLGVPEQLSIVGFDDVHLAGLARIGLTTIRQPIDEIARLGVETLLARMRGELTG